MTTTLRLYPFTENPDISQPAKHVALEDYIASRAGGHIVLPVQIYSGWVFPICKSGKNNPESDCVVSHKYLKCAFVRAAAFAIWAEYQKIEKGSVEEIVPTPVGSLWDPCVRGAISKGHEDSIYSYAAEKYHNDWYNHKTRTADPMRYFRKPMWTLFVPVWLWHLAGSDMTAASVAVVAQAFAVLFPTFRSIHIGAPPKRYAIKRAHLYESGAFMPTLRRQITSMRQWDELIAGKSRMRGPSEPVRALVERGNRHGYTLKEEPLELLVGNGTVVDVPGGAVELVGRVVKTFEDSPTIRWARMYRHEIVPTDQKEASDE